MLILQMSKLLKSDLRVFCKLSLKCKKYYPGQSILGFEHFEHYEYLSTF